MKQENLNKDRRTSPTYVGENLDGRIKTAPISPGVYYFKDSLGKIIYVGKAKNLRNRLKSYSAKNVSAKTAKMLLVAHDLEWEITASELEALVLESKKIREIKPFYNISLKDDKRYTYVYFTDDKFPRIALSHGKPANQNLVSIGPYTNRTMISLVLKEIRKTISFCTCKKNHKKICSNAQMGLCPGYCCSTEMIESIKESDLEKYRRKYLKNINEIMLVLGGRKNGTLSKLEKRITIYIRKEKFEKAKRIKNLERET